MQDTNTTIFAHNIITTFLETKDEKIKVKIVKVTNPSSLLI